MAYLPDQKIIKVNKNETFTNVNELVMLKKNLLDNEVFFLLEERLMWVLIEIFCFIKSPSIYSNRTFTTITTSMLDDSSIEKYERERIKNVRIKCWRVYVKATGIDVGKKEFLIYCESNSFKIQNEHENFLKKNFSFKKME